MSLPQINASDYATKGIRVQTNPMQLPAADAQRKFDELTLDVVVPKFNLLATAQDTVNTNIEGRTATLETKTTSLETRATDVENRATSLEARTTDVENRAAALIDAIPGKANVSDVLTKTNTAEFTPTADYQPATKRYVDINVIQGGVPQTRTVNGHPLSSDVNLTASDVGAPATTIPMKFSIYNGGLRITYDDGQ